MVFNLSMRCLSNLSKSYGLSLSYGFEFEYELWF